MADNKQIVESSTASQEPVGKVFIVYGTAKALSTDGTSRVLAPNSPIFAQDQILTESDGRLSIVFNDSANTQLNLGRMSDIVIDEDVYNTDTVDLAEETSKVQEVQEALLAEDFDPTTELPAPAAGDLGDSSDGGGHPIVEFEATGMVGNVTSGAETRGVTGDFLDPVGGIIEPQLTTSIQPVDITINLSASEEVFEGSSIEYTATLSSPAQEIITITLSNGSIISIPKDEISGAVIIDAPTDDPYIDDGTITANISLADGGGKDINLIINDTPAVTYVADTLDTTTVTLDTASVSENEQNVTFTATLSNTGETDVTVATDHGDIVIAAGETTGTLVIDTADPDVYVDPDTITVNVTSVTGGNFEDVDFSEASATAQITDTFDTTTVTLDTAGVSENEPTVTFTATLSNTGETDVTVVTDHGNIVIAAGDTTGTLVIDTADPDVYVDPDTITVNVTSVTGGNFEDVDFSEASATAKITDTIDTTYASITGPRSVVEGDTTGVYTVTLTNIAQSDVTVKLSYTGTATDGSDYTGEGSIMISQGTSSNTFTLNTLDDFLDEGPESIIITIADVTGGNFESVIPHPNLTESSVTTIITDNIPPEVGSDTVRLSEEGLLDANPDDDGSDDMTNAVTTGTLTIAISDADNDVLSVSLSDPIAQLKSGGQDLTWDGSGPIDGSAYTLVGSVGTTEIVTITIDNKGNYTVTQTGPIDHPAPNVEDDFSFDIPINVNDGTVTSTGTLTVTIEDDSPTIETIGNLHFVSDFAGYDNAIGTYELNASGNPVNAKIIIESTNERVGGSMGTNDQPIGPHNVETKLFIIADGGKISDLGSADLVINPDGTLLINNIATFYNVFYMDKNLNGGEEHFQDENGNFIDSVPPEGGEIHIEDLPLSRSDNDYNDVVLRFEKLEATVDEANLTDGTTPDTGALTIDGNLFSGQGAGFLGISIGADYNGSSLTVTSGIETKTVYFDGDHDSSGNITVASDVGNLTVRGDGSWSYTLRENTLTHPDNDPGEVDVISDGDSDRGVDDQVQDIFDFLVTDGDGDTASTEFFVNINDDGPVAGDPQDAILAHEVSNTATGKLNIDFGADGPAINAIQLTGKTSPSIDDSGVEVHYATDNAGNILSSGGENLIYLDDGNGGLIAQTVVSGVEVFTVTVDPDPVSPTYTVTLKGTIDGAEHIFTNLTTGGIISGIDDSYDFYTGDDNDNDGQGDIKIHITGFDADGNPIDVNSSQQGLGVHDQWISNRQLPNENSQQEDPDSETMYMTFTDTTPGDPSDPSYHLTSAQVTVGSLNFSEEAAWTVYNTNGSQNQADWTEVNSDSANGTAKFNTTFTVDGGIDPLTGQPAEFDAIMLQAGDGDDYRVLGITTYSRSLGDDIDLTYNLQITDGDGDTATSSFDVTFDADGNITGTSADEVISGSSTANTITGGGGEDIIYGGDENDTIFAQDGEPDRISGGDGYDTIEMDISLDILLDDPDTLT
jgi:T1SS-143 domain-containing protein